MSTMNVIASELWEAQIETVDAGFNYRVTLFDKLADEVYCEIIVDDRRKAERIARKLVKA